MSDTTWKPKLPLDIHIDEYGEYDGDSCWVNDSDEVKPILKAAHAEIARLQKAYEESQERIAELENERQWQPYLTIPVQENVLLLCEDGAACEGCFPGDASGGIKYAAKGNPTHWARLPRHKVTE